MTFIFTPNGNEPPCTLKIIDDHILIRELEIRHPEAAYYLRQVPNSQQEAALVGIFEMGFACRQFAQVRQDTAFVEQRMQSLLVEFHHQESAWSEVLSVPVAAYHTYLKAIGLTNALLDEALQLERELKE